MNLNFLLSPRSTPKHRRNASVPEPDLIKALGIPTLKDFETCILYRPLRKKKFRTLDVRKRKLNRKSEEF
jgi:hypothetical protein